MPRNNPILFLMPFMKKSLILAGFSILLSAIAVLLEVGLIGTSAYLISYASLQPSISVLNIPIVGVRFFGISKSVFRYLERLVSHEVNFRLLADLRIWIYRQFVHHIPARKEMKRTGDLMARIVEDVEILEFFFIRVVNPPLTALLTIFIVGFFMGTINTKLTGLYLLLTLISWVLMLVFSYLFAEISSRQFLNIRADLHSEVSDLLDGLPDILMHQRMNDYFSKYRQAEEKYRCSQMNVAIASGSINALQVILTQGSMMAMLIMGIQLVNQDMVPGLLLAVIPLMTFASFDALQPLNLSAQQFHLSSQAAERLQELTRVQNKQTTQINNLSIIHPPEYLTFKSIEIKEVLYTYEDDNAASLSKISLDISPGKKIAIVGPSGSGKTTLARLILGEFVPNNGNIYLNGKPYSNYPKEIITSMVSYSGPSPYFLNAPIRENFKFFTPEISEHEIVLSIHQAQLQDWLLGLNAGIDSVIGERGLKMSEGERRRLDLARTLTLKRPVLILDEPFANQDITNQRSLSSQIHSLDGKTALILITHRLLDMELFDQIIVLNHGVIESTGNLETLSKENGLFKRMWEQQNNMLFDQSNENS